MKKLAVIVIPLYKASPSADEIVSLEQCCCMLHRYPIVFVCGYKLNTGVYETILNRADLTFKKITFADKNFSSIDSYNTFCLDPAFYAAFNEYKYMLLYQLDAFVFSDSLKDWCDRGYDYIGAPLFNPRQSIIPENKMKQAMVGNGGFSLRKIDVFVSILQNKLTLKELWNMRIKRSGYVIPRKIVLYYIVLFLHGRCNTVRNFLMYFIAEDRFFSCVLKHSSLRLNIPEPQVAMYFAFDQEARFLFEQTWYELPFGCHAWPHDKIFWKNYINIK